MSDSAAADKPAGIPIGIPVGIPARIRVLLVDDHELVRRGVEQMLTGEPDLEIVGEAVDGEAAVALAEALRPDVVIMDIQMPRCDGIDATSLIRKSLPGIRVLMLSESPSDEDLFGALRAGASGYVLKSEPLVHLASMVRSVADGGAVFAPSMAAKLVARVNDHPRPAGTIERLTRREREVARLVARGVGNRQIGVELFIAENTVKNHVRAILEKLGVRTRSEVAHVVTREERAVWNSREPQAWHNQAEPKGFPTS